MKRIYWRPQGLSGPVLALIAIVALIGMASVEHFRTRIRQPYLEQKLAAAKHAEAALLGLRAARQQEGMPPIDPEVDPIGTGLIGLTMSSVTSDAGSLAAKQTAINPNFAAVIAGWLLESGVREGDVVAVGASGSFPGINICVYAALEAVGAQPIIITSAASSQWGANIPQLLWLDMERILHEAGLVAFRSVAASMGGVEDRGLGMELAGRELLREGVHRSGLPMIESTTFTESIERRMEIYRQHAGRSPIKAYINVGGGTTSVGTSVGKQLFEPGLNAGMPSGAEAVDSVMMRFSRDGVPVIHLTQIQRLARGYDFPQRPEVMPEVGTGSIYYRKAYNRWLAAAVLGGILLAMYALMHTEFGYQILQSPQRARKKVPREPMV